MSRLRSSWAVSGSSVSSAGFPIWLCGRQDEPARALLGVRGDLAELIDVPELRRFAELALADRAGVRVPQRDQPVGDLLAVDAFGDLLGHLLAAIGEFLQRLGGLELRTRAAPARTTPSGRGQFPRLLDRLLEQRARLAGQLQHLGLRFPGAAADRACQRPELAAHRPGAVPDRGALLADLGRELATLPRERSDAGVRQSRVGRIFHVGFDHGRVDPRRARPEPLLPPGLLNQLARDLVHDLRPQPAGQLADRRLVRHPVAHPDPAEAAQMDRVRHLPHQRLVPPAAAVLDDHQPHVGFHRDRRPAPPRARPRVSASSRSHRTAIGASSPGSASSSSSAREILRQRLDLRRQDLVPQRLRSGRLNRQHAHPPDRS